MWNEEQLIETFLTRYCLDVDFYERANSNGVDYSEFHLLGHKALTDYRKHRLDGLGNDSAYQRIISFHTLANIDDFDNTHNALIEEFQNLILKRKYKILGQKLIEKPLDGSNLITDFLETKAHSTKINTAYEILAKSEYEYTDKVSKGIEKVYIPNWRRLSGMVGGFNPSRLSVLMAPTGFGKTSLSLNLAASAAIEYPTLYLNMEMSQYDIAKRLATNVLQKDYEAFEKENLFEFAKFRFEHKKLFISDGKDLTLEEISAIARRYKKEFGIWFLFIDYDQKLILKLERNEQEWKSLQKAFVALESLAKELEIHVMIMAQTNREGLISGSQRATFHASTVLSFSQEDDGTPLITAIKNRFGVTNSKLEVEYIREKNMISEKNFYFNKGKKL